MILGLDPGQRCGWAVLQGSERYDSGVWDVRPKKRKRDPAHRGYWYQLFANHLNDLLRRLEREVGLPDTIAVEGVVGHKGVYAAHEYGACVALIQVVAFRFDIPVIKIPLGTVKMYATGKGNASKEEMIAAAAARWQFEPERDDEADAAWVAETVRCSAA